MSELWDFYVSVKIEMLTPNSKKKTSCRSEFMYHGADLICNPEMKSPNIVR